MKTEISYRKLRLVDGEIADCIKQINNSISDVESVVNYLRHSEDEALNRVAAKLAGRVENIRHVSKVMASMHTVISNVITSYRNCENTVMEMLEGGQMKRKLVRTPRMINLDHFNAILGNMDLHFHI